jgi:H+-translocating NAD(P) transhydrogenase subunit alpha
MSFHSLLLLADVSSTAAAESAKPDYLALLFVFALATFTGLLVIRNVSRLLHTPLMSLTNAISAIAVVGSIVLAGSPAMRGDQHSTFTTVLGAFAVFASMTNIVSGFLLTDRMLKMFKKREPGK